MIAFKAHLENTLVARAPVRFISTAADTAVSAVLKMASAIFASLRRPATFVRAPQTQIA